MRQKTLCLYFLSLVLLVFNTAKTVAQDCVGYWPLKENAEFELTFYRKGGKKSLATQYKVSSLEKTSTGYIWSVDARMENEKGKLLNDISYQATCENGEVAIDFTSILDPSTWQSIEGMEVEMTADKILITSGLKVGQTLPDAHMEMIVHNGPLKINGKFSLENRKVVAKEKITCPAGTFDCFLITADHNFKLLIGGQYFIKQWIASEAGIIKQETYNKKGKMMGYSELTKLKL